MSNPLELFWYNIICKYNIIKIKLYKQVNINLIKVGSINFTQINSVVLNYFQNNMYNKIFFIYLFLNIV